MNDIVWQDPPDAQPFGGKVGRPSKWPAVALELRRHPGKWALVNTTTSSSWASHVKLGKIPAFAPAGTYDATVRSRRVNGRRVFDVYACFKDAP